MSIRVIVGLGNPGREYGNTRHNIGFSLVDHLAKQWQVVWENKAKFYCQVGKATDPVSGKACFLVKPWKFMNRSGEALQPFLDYYRMPAAEMVVAYDEIQLELGQIKVSVRGSSGGHNGVEDLLRQVGLDFIRLRLGIGPKTPKEIDMKDFVLGTFSAEEKKVLETHLPMMEDALLSVVRDGPDKAMNQFNRKPKNSRPKEAKQTKNNEPKEKLPFDLHSRHPRPGTAGGGDD
ncbi:MAG: aminoacyl-tRNA hydrolase [Opitutales bacterium]|nr:aminoacyl-tRNA hydrolase [Opitutales bacterium]